MYDAPKTTKNMLAQTEKQTTSSYNVFALRTCPSEFERLASMNLDDDEWLGVAHGSAAGLLFWLFVL
jgi:hypothetical protein